MTIRASGALALIAAASVALCGCHKQPPAPTAAAPSLPVQAAKAAKAAQVDAARLAAPEPGDFADQNVKPSRAFYHPELKEFLLMYDDVRQAASPRDALMDFLQSTYDAAANTAHWDRKALER